MATSTQNSTFELVVFLNSLIQIIRWDRDFDIIHLTEGEGVQLACKYDLIVN